MALASDLKPVLPQPGRPLYFAVQDSVRAAVDGGFFQPGQRLPSTKALSNTLDVSLVTVHRALQDLVASGVLRRGQGKGTFVHEDYAARAATTHGQRFGLVVHAESSLADFYHGHLLEGVRRGAETVGADLVILRFGEDWRRECSGFLYVNPMEDQLRRSPWFGKSANRAGRGSRASGDATTRPPAVVVGASFDVPEIVAIDCENLNLGQQAVEHLQQLGHTRIGYVGGTSAIANNRDRWIGFEKACRVMESPVDERMVLRSASWRLEGAEQSDLLAVLGRRDRPTAVFAAGYYFALDVYSAAARLGLSIPGDLSVIAVDDPPSAAHLSPGLTTLRQPLEEMGRLAASTLFSMISNPSGPHANTLLRASLIQRGSTAPPRA